MPTPGRCFQCARKPRETLEAIRAAIPHDPKCQAADVGTGTRVFAIGHPGLEAKVLELTISEGLVSSTRRELDGTVFLQHSAAVNPGNSDGPRLDEHGHLVGLVSRKARLENVAFAVRVQTLRTIFASP